MKITLFWSLDPFKENPYQYLAPSLAMLYISKILEVNGLEVSVIDSPLITSREEFINNPEKMIQKLVEVTEKTNPDILGVGSWTFAMPIVAEFTREFKARNPNVPIILGGINATHVPTETLQLLPHIDFCVRGEGEYTLLELCQTLSSGKKNFGKTKGISYRSKEGRIVHTPDRPLIKNLDELPLVDLECYYDLNKINFEDLRFTISPSRGCINNCSFCNISSMWGKPRFFSPNYIVRQIKHIESLYEPEKIIFEIDNITSNVIWAKKFAKKIHLALPHISWVANARIDMVTKELFMLFKESGIRRVYFGVESINPKILKFLNKTPVPDLYIKKIPKALEILNKLDIITFVVFIIGTPIETNKDLDQLYDYAQFIRKKYNVFNIDMSILTMFPGTQLWYKLAKNELEVQKIPENIKKEWIEKGYLSKIIFEKKYGHLIWMNPTGYVFKSKVMPFKKHLSLLPKFFEDFGYGRELKKSKFYQKRFI
jgi:radical SAM superfamily enzyme YgiQ (UPF0313 family)